MHKVQVIRFDPYDTPSSEHLACFTGFSVQAVSALGSLTPLELRTQCYGRPSGLFRALHPASPPAIANTGHVAGTE